MLAAAILRLAAAILRLVTYRFISCSPIVRSSYRRYLCHLLSLLIISVKSFPIALHHRISLSFPFSPSRQTISLPFIITRITVVEWVRIVPTTEVIISFNYRSSFTHWWFNYSLASTILLLSFPCRLWRTHYDHLHHSFHIITVFGIYSFSKLSRCYYPAIINISHRMCLSPQTSANPILCSSTRH